MCAPEAGRRGRSLGCRLAPSISIVYKARSESVARQSALGVERERWLRSLLWKDRRRESGLWCVGVALVVVLVLSSWLSELIVLP